MTQDQVYRSSSFFRRLSGLSS